MLGAKLGLTAAAAEGRRATEQNVAAFDLETCGAQSPRGAADEGLGVPKPSSATAPAYPSPCLVPSRGQRGPVLALAFPT